MNGEGVKGESFEGYNMSYLSGWCVFVCSRVRKERKWVNETEMKLRVHSELMQYLMTRWIGALLGSVDEEQGEH